RCGRRLYRFCDALGFELCHVVRIAQGKPVVRRDGGTALLCRMYCFVSEQPVALPSCECERLRAEMDVPPQRIGARAEVVGSRSGRRAAVYAYAAEIVTQAL